MKLRKILRYHTVILISIICGTSLSIAQEVVPVKKMHLCSNEGNLWNYRSDCNSESPQLVINALHVKADPLSQILRLEIISDNIGEYTFHLGKFSRFVQFISNDEKNKIDVRNLITSLSGDLAIIGELETLVERIGRSILDNTYTCSSHRSLNYLGLEKSLDGIKFDGRLEAYIEQFRFDKTEAGIFCNGKGRFESDRIIRDVLFDGEKIKKTEAYLKNLKERAEAAEKHVKEQGYILSEAIKKNDRKWETTLSDKYADWTKSKKESDERFEAIMAERDKKYATYYQESQELIASLKAGQSNNVATQLKRQERSFAAEKIALETKASNLKLEHLSQIDQLRSQHVQELQSSNERLISIQEKGLEAQNALSQQIAELTSQNATFESSLRSEYEETASAQSSTLWTAYGIIAFLVMCLAAMLKFAFRKPKEVS